MNFYSLPRDLVHAVRSRHVAWTRHLLLVSVPRQRMGWFELALPHPRATPPLAVLRRSYLISTSRFGVGQVRDTHRTPLGLHRIACKAGDGWPVGTVFEERQPVGFVWAGRPNAPIAHRVLWLEGLESGLNRGGEVDTFSRYIYIHGVGDETTLGHPASRGCIHVASGDLMPLHDRLPMGTLVWIGATPAGMLWPPL